METDIPFRDKVEFLSNDKAAAALQYFRDMLRVSQRDKDYKTHAIALLRMAMVLRVGGQYTKALELLDRAKSMFESMNERHGLGCVYNELAYNNRELQRNALALEYAHQGIRIFQELALTKELAWTYANIAVIYFLLFHRNESLTYAKKAHAIFSEFGSQVGLAWNACHLGNLYCEMGFYDRAEHFCTEALRKFTELKIKPGMAWSMTILGAVFRAQCRFKAASENLMKAKNLFEELGMKDRVGWCLLNEAGIERSTGRHEEALLINKKGIQLFGPLRNHDGVGWGLFQIAQISRDRGQYLKAWQTFREALNLHSDIANRKGMGWGENEWGRTYMELNDQSHARECFIKAKVVAEQLDEGPLKVEVDKNLSNLYLDEGLLQKAEALLDQCDVASKKIQAWETEVGILLTQGKHALILGDVAQARSVIQTAIDLVENYGLVLLAPTVQLFLGEVQMLEGKTNAAIKTWSDVLDSAKKLSQRRPATEALLGLVQVFRKDKTPSQLTALLYQAEKNIRVLSSRKLKAKFMAIKGIVSYQVNGYVEQKYFNQAIQILEACGLTVLQRQVLGLLHGIYSQLLLEKEEQMCADDIKRLLEKSSVDLQLVDPKPDVFERLPVSLVI